jgi:hypothetical protein
MALQMGKRFFAQSRGGSGIYACSLPIFWHFRSVVHAVQNTQAIEVCVLGVCTHVPSLLLFLLLNTVKELIRAVVTSCCAFWVTFEILCLLQVDSIGNTQLFMHVTLSRGIKKELQDV